MNLKEDIKGLWDNKVILKANKIHFAVIVLMFFITVILVSIPNYYGLLNGLKDIDQLEGLEQSFIEMYDEKISCWIDQDAQMTCEVDMLQHSYGSYEVIYQNELDTDGIVESSIIFGRENFAAIYVNPDDQAFIVTGNYQLLKEFDFRKVNDQMSGDKLEYQTNITDIFISNIYKSTMPDKIVLIFSTQFTQLLIYLVIITFMLMIVNFRSKKQKIGYMTATKIVIASMLGPALLSAILGVFIAGWASIIFTLLYAIRIMFIYYQIHRAQSL